MIGQLFDKNPDENFYERKFIVDKNPEDLSEFYGSDELMRIFCIFPFISNILMKSGYWDDEGNYNTYGIPFGKMKATIEFDETERDTTGDGIKDEVIGFNKRERFHDILFGKTLWDQVTNFGFKKLPDGKCECYQKGEYFYGFWPMKKIFQLHSYIVSWKIQNHLNSSTFENTTTEPVIKELTVSKQVFINFLKSLRVDLEEKLEYSHNEKCLELMSSIDIIVNDYSKVNNINFIKLYIRKRIGSSELSLLIDNDCIKDVVKKSIEIIHASDDDTRHWSFRTLTPTWIDGKQLHCRSNAWKSLISTLLLENIN